MVRLDRSATNFSDNLLDYFLTFNSDSSWTVSSGTGTGTHSTDFAFNGTRSLKIQNTAPTTDITVTNSVQNSIIALKTATCFLSFYIRKDNASDAYTGEVEIFKNAVSVGTETWSLVATEDDQWYRFISDTSYSFVLDDIITFTFTFDGDAGFVGSKTIYIDGMMLHNAERNDFAAPLYKEPERAGLSSVTRKTANTTLDNTYYQWNFNTDGGDLTASLPSGTQSTAYKVVNSGTSGNTLSVSPNGVELLMGANSDFDLADGESLIIAYDSTDGWY